MELNHVLHPISEKKLKPFKLIGMELKKNPKVNLEKSKALFFQAGMILSLGLALTAFEWYSEDNGHKLIAYNASNAGEVEMIPVTPAQKDPVALPPAPQPISLDIVDNNSTLTVEMPVIDNTDGRGQSFNIVPFQDDPETGSDDPVDFLPLEDMPKYHGGDMSEFHRFVAKAVSYPARAQENGVQGTVYIGFVIDEMGNLINARVIRSSGNADLDAEALRAVKTSDRWTPGKQRDHSVKVNCSIPVVFRFTN